MSLNYTDVFGNIWYINNNGNLDNASSRYQPGSSWTQDTLSSTNINLFVGNSISPSWLTTRSYTGSGNTHTVTAGNTYDGIELTRKSLVADGYVRMLEIITNTGSAAKSVKVELEESINYYSSTQIVATASGDTTRTNLDHWSSYGNSYYTNYPVLTHVVSGGAESSAAVSSSSSNQASTTFNLNLQPGESKVVMHFYALSANATQATAIGSNLSTLTADAYLSGLTTLELNALVNFTKDFTVGVTTTLPSYGLNISLTGSSSINATGNARHNTLTGNSAGNELFGLSGNDTLDGRGGDDTLVGGVGDDTYYVDSLSDVITESSGEGQDTVVTALSYSLDSRPYIENVILTGTNSGVSATGNTANNLLNGSQHSGANTLTGGAGDDTYVLGLKDTVVELSGQGNDSVHSNGTFLLGDHLENLLLLGTGNFTGTGNGVSNRITGNSGKNTLTGLAGNDTLDGAEDADVMIGGDGSDSYYVDHHEDSVIESSSSAAGGTDTVYAKISYSLPTNVENLTLEGNAYKAIGNSLDNKITGNSGRNFLDGGSGLDTLTGDAGDDIYIVGAGDIITETYNQGTDTVHTGLTTYTLGSHIENGQMLNGSSVMNGNELTNSITGNLRNNTITGGIGNDTLNGQGGHDSLLGGDGNDVLIGDNGNPDSVSSSKEMIVNDQIVALNVSSPESAIGTVKVSGSISTLSADQTSINIVYVVDHSGSMSAEFKGTTNTGDQNSDGNSNTVLDAAIASVGKLNRSVIDSGLGNSVNVTLVQFDDTAEILYTGNPTRDGNGNGTFDVLDQLSALKTGGGTAYNAALTAVKNHLSSIGSGTNIVFFLSDGEPTDGTTYQATAEQLRALGEKGTVIKSIGMGSGARENPLDLLDDGIDNNSAIIAMNPEDLDASLLNNSVLELADAQWLEIYLNDDLVDLIGPDRFTISPLGMRFESNAITLSVKGTDQISTRLMTVSSSGSMVETTIPVEVSAFQSNDTLDGGAGDDILNGGYGTDLMRGGTGSDTYVIDNLGDVLVELAGEGIDTVRSILSSYTLPVHVENLQLIQSARNGTGNDVSNLMVGNDLNNVLFGLAGSDTLEGGKGNDTLDGGTGLDLLKGGEGDDTYFVDATASDSIQESSTGGTDTVVVSFNATLGGTVSSALISVSYTNIENLTLHQSSSATTAIGSTLDNVIVGNSLNNSLYGLAGNDTLNGGTGADTMDGGEGNDTYHVDNSKDLIIDSSGIDTVILSVNAHQLANGIENITFTEKSSVLTAYGNSTSNSITGNSFNNILDGGLGADTMMGGKGNDTYYIDHINDIMVEKLNEGSDIVFSTVNHILAQNIENLVLAGTSGIAGAGNSSANKISGNSGNNRLLGWSGNDSLEGGVGNDYLIGHQGNDNLLGGLGKDTMSGGDGNDVFIFNSISETGSTPSSGDTILDFASGRDKIDLSGIDARSATSANEAFSSTLISSNSQFTAAGQLKFKEGVLYGNTDANFATSEFAIILTGTKSLTSVDFIL